jgi:DNA repair exonuclease SbcCD nuclease subunit
MRIAITADLHLRQSNPERTENFEVLVQQILSRGIRLLIIAGDLFDARDGTYGQVDSMAERFPELQLLLLPGNHDADLRAGMFASHNIQVLARPVVKRMDRRLFLFLPYKQGSTMGESIASLPESERLRERSWILVSHGDFGPPKPRENGRERGYFPLTREDLARFRPAKVILGHIHLPNSVHEHIVHPGSPYPITADEYGPRRVLILDTDSAQVGELALSHPPIYLQAEVFLVPNGREGEQIRSQLAGRLQNLPRGRLTMQVLLKGYTSSRSQARRLVETFLSERGIVCSRIDLESLKVSDDESLGALADTVRNRIRKLQLDYEEAEALREAVLEKALRILYGA